MKTIAIIESCDTKYSEAQYMKSFIEKEGVHGLIIDVSTGSRVPEIADITREEVIASIGKEWKDLINKTKAEKISEMTAAITHLIKSLCEKEEINGVLSVGGMQNTIMATKAMMSLPIGYPKVMATTVASGRKVFQDVVGDKDIVVIPSISDFTGMNLVTRAIIEKACICCLGMVKANNYEIKKLDRKVVGISLMGVTNHGAMGAIAELEENGIEAVGFHATGVGGSCMEEMVETGLIDGVIDLTTHEIAAGFFGCGYSYGDKWMGRITRSLQAKIPLVVSVGGLDFCDFDIKEFPYPLEQRLYMMHNPYMTHIKLLPEEADAVGTLFCERVESTTYPIHVVIPTEGMRKNTRPGEELFDQNIDNIILDRIRAIKNPNVTISVIEGNLDTEKWGRRAAQILISELNKADKEGE